MATEAYVDDIVTLVQALTQAEVARALIERVPDADESGEVYITVRVSSPELRPAVAVQQSLQLSLDAAAIVVAFPSWSEPDIDRNRVAAILRDRTIELTIVDLRTGSLIGRFTINPRTEKGRRRLLAIAGLAAIALSIIYPPASIAVAIVGGLGGLNDILTPDAIVQAQAATDGTQLPMKTLDQSDVPPGNVSVIIEGSRNTLDPPKVLPEIGSEGSDGRQEVQVVDIELDGLLSADQAFLDHLHQVPSVQGQTRFIFGLEPAGPRLVRVWSDETLDSDILHRLATDSGTSIVSISPA